MAALSTYTPIATYTVPSATSSYTFSSISGSYTDLVLIVNAKSTSGGVDVSMRFNGDTASNYSKTNLYGDAGGATSTRQSNQTQGNINLAGYITTTFGPYQIVNIMNYANTTTYKTYLSRAGNTSVGVDAIVGTWRKTPEAITSITLFVSGDTFASGSTFSLYGIANNTAGAKATGGVISSDSSYFYHSFYATGTFTPTQSLTCDYLVVAGGAGGGYNNGGGGGAGGFRTSIGGSPLSVTATGYTITVGAGGAGAANTSVQGGTGGNSTFSTITSDGGGGGGSGSIPAGANGGSGGGVRLNSTAAAGTGVSGQGNNGGVSGSAPRGAGAGGGAGAVGGNGDASYNGGVGGVGLSSTLNTQALAVYYAGGGGGSGLTDASSGAGGNGGGGAGKGNVGVAGIAGTAGTGGGGGGGGDTAVGGAGGSGVVIIRYAR